VGADAARIVSLLAERHETVSLAETTAGGLLTAALIAVPGASSVTPGGIVPYDNRPKVQLLGVSKALLRAHGAVSGECVAAMAEGVRAVFRTTWGLAESGIAGPGAGSAEKPAGTLYAAIAGPSGVSVQRWHFAGDRNEIMDQAARSFLRWFRDVLEAGPAESA
jgi:PncC family amidohydrolase